MRSALAWKQQPATRKRFHISAFFLFLELTYCTANRVGKSLGASSCCIDWRHRCELTSSDCRGGFGHGIYDCYPRTVQRDWNHATSMAGKASEQRHRSVLSEHLLFFFILKKCFCRTLWRNRWRLMANMARACIDSFLQYSYGTDSCRARAI